MKKSERRALEDLRDLIVRAIDEELNAAEVTPDQAGEITVYISPNLDEVQVYLDGRGNDELEGWFVESAYTYEDALYIADKYFDIR